MALLRHATTIDPSAKHLQVQHLGINKIKCSSPGHARQVASIYIEEGRRVSVNGCNVIIGGTHKQKKARVVDSLAEELNKRGLV